MPTQIAHQTGANLTLLDRIQRSGGAVIRVDRDLGLLGAERGNALRLALAQLTNAGWLRRLENGTYAVAAVRGAEVHSQLALVADWFEGEPYVVTGFFALAHWNLTGHPPQTVDVLLTRRKPNVRYQQSLFRFVYTPKAKMPVAKEVHAPGARADARIVGPEQALLDVLSGRYAVDIDTAIEAFERGLRFGVLNRRTLVALARRAPSVAARRLGWIADRQNDPLGDNLRPLVGRDGYVPVARGRLAKGAVRNARWYLLENAG